MENIEQLLNDLSDIFDSGNTGRGNTGRGVVGTNGPEIGAPSVDTAPPINFNQTIDIDIEELARARDRLIYCNVGDKPQNETMCGGDYPDHPKHKIINEFIDAESSHGISQGSEEWHRRRAYGVGGSQISTIMGINTFTTLRKYVYEKLGLESRAGALRMWWGIIFEDVIAQYVEKIYNTRILGANMFIDRMPLYYSPDGLMVIDNEIVLLEFKSLYSRIPNKHVPEYYIPQPKMGLEIIKIADYSLFIEAVFRRCRWDEMNSGKLFDKSLGQKNTGKYVLAYGFMLITRPNDQNNDRTDNDNGRGNETGRPEPGELIDYGTAGLEHLEKMFYNACMAAPCARWSVKNSSVMVCGLPAFSHKLDSIKDGPKINGGRDDSANMDKLKIERAEMITRARESGEIPIGIMPWKLIRADFHKIEREPGFLDPYMEKITEFAKCIIAADQYPKDMAPEDIKRYKTEIAEKFLEKYDNGGDTGKPGGHSYYSRPRYDNNFINVNEYISTLDNIDAGNIDSTDTTEEIPGAVGSGMEDFINFAI